MSTTITALQFDKFGDYKEVLYVNKNATKPKIAKDTDVLVRIKAATINPSDKGYIGGGYSSSANFPATPGFEGAGVIEEIGSAVKDYTVGQRVHVKQPGVGAWSEYAVFDSSNPAARIIPLPESVSPSEKIVRLVSRKLFEEGAQLSINPITVYGLLDVLNPLKGEFVLQTAAASALGRFFIYLAKERGLKTINVVRRDNQIEELKSLGADYVINSENTDLVAKVQEITNGKGVKYAVDAVGGALATLLTKTLAVDGLLLLYGMLDRTTPFAPAPRDLMFREAAVKGFALSSWSAKNPQKAKDSYTDLVNILAAKKFTLESKTFDAKTQHLEALEHSVSPGKSEKTILLF